MDAHFRIIFGTFAVFALLRVMLSYFLIRRLQQQHPDVHQRLGEPTVVDAWSTLFAGRWRPRWQLYRFLYTFNFLNVRDARLQSIACAFVITDIALIALVVTALTMALTASTPRPSPKDNSAPVELAVE
jgi:hypothetical protein